VPGQRLGRRPTPYRGTRGRRQGARPNLDSGVSQIPFRLSDSEVAMKNAIGVVLIVLVALYVTDQLVAQGKYTDAAQRMAQQIRHSTGI
jgi:hypothetical protein